jgi:hypothetical protein
MRYRKKPVVVEARQWDGSAAGATPIIDWILADGGTGRYVDHPPTLHSVRCRCDGRGVVPGKNQAMQCPETQPTGGTPSTLNIDTLEGTMTVSVGDWIIRGVQGEFYPCKPHIFEATYEPAHEVTP